MYSRTTAGSAHGDFQDRNGVNYVTSAESFGHCSQLFWKKDPNDAGPTSTIGWCDQLPTPTTPSVLSLETRAAAAAAAAVIAHMDADVRPYACDQCSCAYIYNSSLTNHKLTHRTGDFRCEFCSKPYNNYMSLRNHMRTHGVKRFMCDLCGKSFRLGRYLRSHQKVHDYEPHRFDCPKCCKTFRTMLELAQHRCNNTSSQSGSQSGSRRNDFGRHPQHQQNNTTAPMMQQQSHGGHGQQDTLPPHSVSPMSQGGGVVASNNNDMSLSNHMRTDESKRFKCDLCGKSFRFARYLRSHQKIHDYGPNRFDCPNCSKTFRTMLELAQHRCVNAASQSGSRRNNFGRHPQPQQNNTTAPMMQQQSHGGHGQQDPLPPHCVSPMSQGGGVVASNTIPDAHQGHSSSSSQSHASQQSMRSSSSSNKHSSSSSGSSYSLLQPLVPEPKHQDTFSMAPQRPMALFSPIRENERGYNFASSVSRNMKSM